MTKDFKIAQERKKEVINTYGGKKLSKMLGKARLNLEILENSKTRDETRKNSEKTKPPSAFFKLS